MITDNHTGSCSNVALISFASKNVSFMKRPILGRNDGSQGAREPNTVCSRQPTDGAVGRIISGREESAYRAKVIPSIWVSLSPRKHNVRNETITMTMMVADPRTLLYLVFFFFFA